MMFVLLALFAVAAAEECQMMCNYNYEPVCGSDGRTYGNACELISTACLKKSAVRKMHNGECQAEKMTRMTGCAIACTMDYTPVCGSDGVTYGNACELTTQSCLKRNNVVQAYQGECSVGCQRMCTMNWEPVCGTDGETYSNECELTSLACMRRSAVRIARKGEC